MFGIGRISGDWLVVSISKGDGHRVESSGGHVRSAGDAVINARRSAANARDRTQPSKHDRPRACRVRRSAFFPLNEPSTGRSRSLAAFVNFAGSTSKSSGA